MRDRRPRAGRKKPKSKRKTPLWVDYLVLFVAGIVWDAILSADVIFTSMFNIAWAMATTAIINVLSFAMYDKVITKRGIDRRKLAALTIGSSIGAGIVTYMFK